MDAEGKCRYCKTMVSKGRKTLKMDIMTDEKGEMFILDKNGKKVYL